jgi:hypothetical protein
MRDTSSAWSGAGAVNWIMLDNRPPCPKARPAHENPDPLSTFSYRGNKALLGFIMVGG